MKVILHRSAKKFLKKCSFELYTKTQEEVDNIVKHPRKADSLTGEFKHIRSKHFSFKGTEYRIAYVIRGDILILLIGTRENFYQNLKRIS